MAGRVRKRRRAKPGTDSPRHDRRGKLYYGIVRADESYTMEQFTELTGLGPSAIRMAELKGLRTATVGVRKMIRGAAWLEYLAQLESEQG